MRLLQLVEPFLDLALGLLDVVVDAVNDAALHRYHLGDVAEDLVQFLDRFADLVDLLLPLDDSPSVVLGELSLSLEAAILGEEMRQSNASRSLD